MVFYLVFLGLFSYTTLSEPNEQDLFYFSDNTKTQLTLVEFPFTSAHVQKSFVDIATIEEFHQYLQGPFFTGIFQSSTYDGDILFPQANVSNNEGSAAMRPGSMLGYNRIVGPIRIGQSRVKRGPCRAPSLLKPGAGWGSDSNGMVGDDWACYPIFTRQSEDLSSFGLLGTEVETTRLRVSSNGTRYEDSWSSSGAWPPYHGKRSDSEPVFTVPKSGRTFPTPSFSVELPPVRDGDASGRVMQALKAMQHGKWVDVKTRAVFIDMTVYNPNLDHMCLVRLICEMPRSGGVMTSVDFQTLRMYRYTSQDDWRMFGTECVVLAFVVVYTLQEIRKLGDHGHKYFLSYVNFPHFINLALFYVVVYLRVQTQLALPASVDAASPTFIDFRTARTFLKESRDVNAFNALLSWLKLFKYLNHIPKFSMLLGTLKNAAGKLSGFTLICMILLFGWGIAFMLTFGTQLYAFRNMGMSFFAQMRLLLGDFDFEAMRQVNPLMGPLMFMVFIILVVFVVLNMFIAIISDAFADTKAELENMEDVGLASLGADIVHFLTYGVLFRLPLIGSPLEKLYSVTTTGVRRTTQMVEQKLQDAVGAVGHAADNAMEDVAAAGMAMHRTSSAAVSTATAKAAAAVVPSSVTQQLAGDATAKAAAESSPRRGSARAWAAAANSNAASDRYEPACPASPAAVVTPVRAASALSPPGSLARAQSGEHITTRSLVAKIEGSGVDVAELDSILDQLAARPAQSTPNSPKRRHSFVDRSADVRQLREGQQRLQNELSSIREMLQTVLQRLER